MILPFKLEKYRKHRKELEITVIVAVLPFGAAAASSLTLSSAYEN